MTPHSLLLAAAREIRQRGWRREGDDAPLRAVCIVAAVLVVQRAGVTTQLRHAALALLCEGLGFPSRLELADWNNAAERTVEDVLAALEAVSAGWRNTTPKLFAMFATIKALGRGPLSDVAELVP